MNRIITIFITFSLVLFNYEIARSQWSNPIMITENTNGASLYPNVLLTEKKNIGCIWIHKNNFDDAYSLILYRELKDVNLSKIDTLSTSGYAWAMPKVFTISDSKLLAIWVDNTVGAVGSFEPTTGVYNVVYAIKNNGVWSKPIQLKGFDFESPDLVVKKNKNGDLFLVINEISDSYLMQFNGMEWVKCVFIPYDFIYSDFIIDQNGKIEMAFMAPEGAGDGNSIFFLTTDSTYKKWYNPIIVQKGGQYFNTELMFTDDISNRRHLIWKKQTSASLQSVSLLHSISLDGNTWTIPENIIKTSSYKKKYDYPCVIKLDGSKFLLYWMATASNNYSVDYTVYNGKEWLPPVTAVEKAMYPSIYRDDEGTIHLVYMNQKSSVDEPSQIYYLCNKNSSLSTNEIKELPNETSLIQNYPNPFNSETVIKYKLAKTGDVKIIVYNAIGQEIETIINCNELPGEHIAYWKPKGVSSGIYYYRMVTDNKQETKKMLYLK